MPLKGLEEVRVTTSALAAAGWSVSVTAPNYQIANAQAVDNLWRFTGELFLADEVELSLVEQGIAVDPQA